MRFDRLRSTSYSLKRHGGVFHRYRKAKNRLLKCCYVPSTSAAQNRLLFYFFFCCGCLQYYRANKASLKQSIILRCLWGIHIKKKLFFNFLSSIKNINQVPVPNARWQHGSQMCFETVFVKNHKKIKLY